MVTLASLPQNGGNLTGAISVASGFPTGQCQRAVRAQRRQRPLHDRREPENPGRHRGRRNPGVLDRAAFVRDAGAQRALGPEIVRRC